MRTFHKLRAVGVAGGMVLAMVAGGCDIGVTVPQDPPATGEPGGTAPADDAAVTTEADDPPPLLLVMDASGSMNRAGPDGRTLLEDAKQALRDLIERLPDGQPTGLRVYGHRVPNTDRENGCQDTELVSPVAPLDRAGLIASVDSYQAVGFTPIGLALREGAGDLPPEGERTIVLVSDGEDTCAPPAPCDVVDDLADAGVELVIHTVGFALGDNDQARRELDCIAEAGGGEFYDVRTAPELAAALDEATRDRRTAQLAGAELTGAALPRDASTGELDTPYVDTVLHGEANFYRFVVAPGSQVRAEVIATTAIGCGLLTTRVEVVDATGQRLTEDSFGQALLVPADEPIVVHTTPVTVEDGEAFIKVKAERDVAAGCADRPVVEFDVELQLAVVG